MTLYVSEDMTMDQLRDLVRRHSEEQPFQIIGPEATCTPGILEYTVRSFVHMDFVRTNKEKDMVQDIMSMSAAYKWKVHDQYVRKHGEVKEEGKEQEKEQETGKDVGPSLGDREVVC